MKSLVLLPARMVQLMRQRRNERLPRETGGFPIGVRRGVHIEVTDSTEQGPGDLATGASFERRCPSHRIRIHEAWGASDRYESLVGDWHSHPFGMGDASLTDRSAWRTLARTSERPDVGLIAAEALTPRLFLTPGSWLGSGPGRELALIERTADLLAFGDIHWMAGIE